MIYLLGDQATSPQPGPFLVPVFREEADSPEGAIRALLSGPTPLEQELGLSSAIPAGVELNELSQEGQQVAVDLSADFESGGGTQSMTSRLAQLTYTVTRAVASESFTLLLDGEEVEVVSGEGLVLDQPLQRSPTDEVVPPLLVETPAVLQPVAFPLQVTGQAPPGVVEYSLTNWDGLIVAEGTTDVEGEGGFSLLVEVPPDAPLENLGGAPVDGTLIVSTAEGWVAEYPLRFPRE